MKLLVGLHEWNDSAWRSLADRRATPRCQAPLHNRREPENGHDLAHAGAGEAFAPAMSGWLTACAVLGELGIESHFEECCKWGPILSFY